MSLTSIAAQVRKRPILIAFAVFWVLEAGFNSLYGYHSTAGWARLLYAGAFVALAVIAAWLPGRVYSHWRAGKHGLALVLAPPLLACVLVSQMTGWSVLGVTLADGQVARDTAATQHGVAGDKLAQARDDRKALGVQPSPAEVQGQIAALLARFHKGAKTTIGEATQQCTDPLPAPQTCRQVAELKATLAKADRAVALDQAIDADVGALGKGEQVADGHPGQRILAGVATMVVRAWSGEDAAPVTPDDVLFGWTIFFVALVGFFANFGFTLAGVGVDAVAQAEEPDEWSRTFGTRRLQAPPDWEPPPPREEPKQRGGMPSRSVHGAPININFAGHPGPNGFTGAVGTPGPIGDPGPISMPPRTRPMVIEAEAPAAPARPVDRGRIQELCDHLLCFQAACLAESSGATLDASAMYERYQAWAGTRAIARAAFDTMFSELTAIDRVEFGGVPHYRGVALKGGVALRSVG